MKSSRILTALILCSLAVLVMPIAGGITTDTATSHEESVFSHAILDTDTSNEEPLLSGNGSVEVLVRIEASDPSTELPDDANQSAVEQLQRRAAESQAPLLSYANTTDAVSVENTFWLANRVLVTVDTNEVPVSALLEVSGVESVGSNFEVSSFSEPSTATTTGATIRHQSVANLIPSPTLGGPLTPDTGLTQTTVQPRDIQTTYGLEMIRAPLAWQVFANRGEGSRVTVLDTGIDANHTDLNLSVWAEFNSSGDQINTSPQDYGTHGTHVSGTVAGGDASGRHIGVAPGTELHHGAVLTDCNPDCVGTFSQIIGGMQWAVNNSADVISLSLGADGYYSDFIDPIRNAHAAGTVVVAAVGNGGSGTSSSPGNVYDAIAVGAVDQNRDVPGFSSGEQIDTVSDWGPAAPADWPPQYIVPSITAPGSGVYSTLPGDDYGTKGGTSMATPHVSGAAAIVQTVTDVNVSPADLERAFEEAATKPSGASEPAGTRDTRYGSGIIDIPETVAFIDGPFPRFVINQTTPYVNESVSFDGTPTFGNITTYHWDYNEDMFTDAFGPTVNHSYATAGTRNVSLTVTDDQARVNGTNKTITVIERPAANFTLTPPYPKPGEETTFDGTLSHGDIETYEWDLTDDGTTDATGPMVNWTFSQEGRFNVSLTVTDVRGQQNQLIREIIVSELPTANFTIDPQQPDTDETVTFDGNSSIGNITTYEWDLTGDGTIDTTGANTTWSYQDDAVISVTLTVTDNQSRTDSWSQTLIVGVPPIVHNTPPKDLTDDGLYRDIDGDGSFDIFDVQAFYAERDSDPVQNNPGKFDFDGSGSIDILDVQELFVDLQQNVAG